MGEQGARQKGTVKWFNATKGFGFITPEGGGEDLFVHQTNITAEGFRSLRQDEAVEFEVETSPDGRQKAINVTGPSGKAPQGAPPRRNQANFQRGGGRAGRGRQPQQFYGYPTMAPYGMPPYGMYYFPGAQGMYGMPQQHQAPPAEPSGLQVVVHNLPWSFQWQQLKDYFKEWKVERADIMYDMYNRSRGWGTVRFSSREDAVAACQKLNNSQIEGRTISVRIDRFA